MEITPKSLAIFTKNNEKTVESTKESENTIESNQKKLRPTTEVRFSAMAKNFHNALNLLEKEEVARPEAVSRGREIIENWQPPSDSQVDKIMNDIVDQG